MRFVFMRRVKWLRLYYLEVRRGALDLPLYDKEYIHTLEKKGKRVCEKDGLIFYTVPNEYESLSGFWVSEMELFMDLPVYHFGVSGGAKEALMRALTMEGELGYSGGADDLAFVMYHGTDSTNVESIIRTGIRATEKGMMGSAVYLGTFFKGVRFAFFESYWDRRRDPRRKNGSVFRVLVLTKKSRHKEVNGDDQKCGCSTCEVQAKRGVSNDLKESLVDHEGRWMKDFDTCLVPPFEWTKGKRLVSSPELAITPGLSLCLLDVGHMDMSTQGRNYEKDRDDHRIASHSILF